MCRLTAEPLSVQDINHYNCSIHMVHVLSYTHTDINRHERAYILGNFSEIT